MPAAARSLFFESAAFNEKIAGQVFEHQVPEYAAIKFSYLDFNKFVILKKSFTYDIKLIEMNRGIEPIKVALLFRNFRLSIV